MSDAYVSSIEPSPDFDLPAPTVRVLDRHGLPHLDPWWRHVRTTTAEEYSLDPPRRPPPDNDWLEEPDEPPRPRFRFRSPLRWERR